MYRFLLLCIKYFSKYLLLINSERSFLNNLILKLLQNKVSHEIQNSTVQISSVVISE